MAGDAAVLLERLLADGALRRRFQADPVAVAKEAGFPELAEALSNADDRDGRRLDARESRSSAAGFFLAAALEGLSLLDFGADEASAAGEAAPPGAAPASSTAADSHAPDPVPAAAEQAAALSPNPDDWEGNLDDEDAGSDEVDGSNENEPDVGGGAHDNSASSGTGDGAASAEAGGDDENEDEPDEDEDDENENEGQDEIGEGSRGEDATDDNAGSSDHSDTSASSDDSDESGDSEQSDDSSSDGGGDASPAPDGDHAGSGNAPPGVEDGVDGLEAGPRALTAVAAARSELGTSYHWGGSSPTTGFDCSGLMQWAYAKAGIRIPRVTYDQIDVGQHIPRSKLLPGDLVFFQDASGDVRHVGMSLGGDKFIQAPHTGDVVKISSLNEPYYAREFAGGRRIAAAVEGGQRGGSPAPHVDEARQETEAKAVRRAQRGVERDAAEARRPGTQLFKALERQERGKGEPPSRPAASGAEGAADRAGSGGTPAPPAAADTPLDPAAQDAATHLTQVHYGFVRDSLNTPGYGELKAAGYNGILFHANDPHLGEAIASARAAGFQSVGIWAPANLEDPATFARRLAELGEQYKPDIVVPDVEIEGKGYPGSPGWDYSEQFAKLYRQLAPNQRWAVTVMGYQDDFDYGAYVQRGASVWPQSYGATYETTYDPKSVVDWVVRNGVDPRLVNPVLAPNQSGDDVSGYASYALEDFNGKFPSYTR